MKKLIIFFGCFLLLLFINSFSQQGGSGGLQGQEKVSGKNIKATYLADPQIPFKLIITDDPSDEIEAKGSLLVHCSGGFSWEFTFHLKKGGSATYEFGLEDKVEKVTIDLKEGSIFIDHGNKLKKETKKEEPAGKPLQEKIPISKGSFSADYVMNIKGQIIKGKIYLKDHIYRYDMIPEEAKESKVKDEIKTQLGKVTVETSVKVENVSYIINQKSGQALIINHDEKVYGEATRDMTDIYNPIEAHYSLRELYTLLDKGEEKIGDLACQKRELRMDNLLIQTAWIAKKYLFPIKIINYVQGEEHTVFEVKNIKEERLDPKIFEVPAGYKKIIIE